MTIKYKGLTSDLLADLSLQFGPTINLNKSKEILVHFFQCIMEDLTTDKKVQLICSLPHHIKPFCNGISYSSETTSLLFKTHTEEKTIASILIILKKYIPEASFLQIYRYYTDHVFRGTDAQPEKIFQVA